MFAGRDINGRARCWKLINMLGEENMKKILEKIANMVRRQEPTVQVTPRHVGRRIVTKHVAYIYFKTPSTEKIEDLFTCICSAGVNVTNFGVNDPPPKRVTIPAEMAMELIKQPESNKYAFLKDKNLKLEIDVQINYDPRWTFSTISMSSPNEHEIRRIAKYISCSINAYLSIKGVLGAGKDQLWDAIYENEDCPVELKSKIIFSAQPVR
jgi:hypothetical protein